MRQLIITVIRNAWRFLHRGSFSKWLSSAETASVFGSHPGTLTLSTNSATVSWKSANFLLQRVRAIRALLCTAVQFCPWSYACNISGFSKIFKRISSLQVFPLKFCIIIISPMRTTYQRYISFFLISSLYLYCGVQARYWAETSKGETTTAVAMQ
jgi:hypothetical protein